MDFSSENITLMFHWFYSAIVSYYLELSNLEVFTDIFTSHLVLEEFNVFVFMEHEICLSYAIALKLLSSDDAARQRKQKGRGRPKKTWINEVWAAAEKRWQDGKMHPRKKTIGEKFGTECQNIGRKVLRLE